MTSKLSFFFSFSFFCCHVYKTIYSSFISWRFTLTFSSKTFTVLALTFRYLIIWSILSWFLCLVREVGVQLLSLACGFSVVLGFPSGPSGKEPACQCRGCKICGFDSWVRKIPWRSKWHPSILAWNIPWAEEPGGLWTMGPPRVGHDWVTEHMFTVSAPFVEKTILSLLYCLAPESKIN